MTGLQLDAAVLDLLHARHVRHLTHFSASRNLPQIFESGAILSTESLLALGAAYEPTDASRFDGRPDLICCNIDLPNTRYFYVARGKDSAANYPDWVIFLINPDIASRIGTGFAPANAAKGNGRDIAEGAAALDRLYAPAVSEYRRGASHLPSSPTHPQAEVLVPGRIDLSDILGIVATSHSHARAERSRLRQLGHDPDVVAWYVSPDLFQTSKVGPAIATGQQVVMEHWDESKREGTW